MALTLRQKSSIADLLAQLAELAQCKDIDTTATLVRMICTDAGIKRQEVGRHLTGELGARLSN